MLMKLSSANKETYDSLAKCLTTKGVKFYGAYWCPHCANQKALFGDAARYLPYIECADPANPQEVNAICKDNGVTGYPTWVFPGGKRLSGEVPLKNLAEESGCTF